MKMADSSRRFATRKDFIILGALLLFAGGWLLFRHVFAAPASTVEAQIYYNSKLVQTVMLASGLNEKFEVPGQPNVVLQVADGKIRFYSSTCPDQICVRAGYLSRPGESAACLPNKVAVKLVAVGKTGKDAPDTYIS